MRRYQKEIIVDNFAGGGGASTGIEMAIGRSVDIAINHDPAAIAMHKANHPETEHYCESVWDVDPIKACKGRPVALAWFSPDCRHFSKAKGGKPVDKNIRGLAWIAVKWAKLVKPRVIILENVEEFKTWGPLIKDDLGNLYPDPQRKGETFILFVKALEKHGYKVEFKELRACDYGAPTIRKRFFMIARCDGKKIVWAEPTHGDPNSLEVRMGKLKPWRTAAECIDWSIPCPSIFERKKPLAENTLKRIAKGIKKFVIDNPSPYILKESEDGIITPVISQIGQTGGGDRLHDIKDPLSTIVSKAEHLLVTPFLAQYHTETEKNDVRGQEIEKPICTLDTSNRYGLVAAFISKYFGGFYDGAGSAIDEPLGTQTTKERNALITSHLLQMNNNCDGRSMENPFNTIVAGGGHWGEVRTFLTTYYGNSSDIGQPLQEPMRTIVSKDRFGLVTIKGQDYQIVDIGMRMLEPKELFKAQGFPDEYVIDKDYKGDPYPKTAQVARCGNAVPPPFAEALTRVNLPEYCMEETEQQEVI